MLIQSLHPRAPSTSDAVELLLQCHWRIRHFTSLAGRVARASAAPASEIAEAARQLERYFASALPLHVADEEQSIEPRLLGFDPQLDHALQRMAAEHLEAEEALAELTAVCRRLFETEGRDGALQRRLKPSADRLEELFTRHLAAEEAVIFPALRARLSPAALEIVVAEMRSRRQNSLTGEVERGRPDQD